MENLSNKKAEDYLGDDDHNLMMNALQMLIVTYEGKLRDNDINETYAAFLNDSIKRALNILRIGEDKETQFYKNVLQYLDADETLSSDTKYERFSPELYKKIMEEDDER
tara:strand:+ start:294 stop:620 length:327 start_codon:yes stop_codon:yes gene_type:complete